MRAVYIFVAHPMKTLGLLLAMSLAASAGEYACLSSGFRIHADRHEVDGGMVKLHTQNGVIELPASQITQFEQEEYTAPPPPPTPAVAAQTLSVETKKLSPHDLVTQAAVRAGLPPELVHSLARAESAYQTNALSNKGAIGLMQLMPGTAAALGVNPHDPEQNADGGAAYLRDLLIRYQDDPHQVSKAVAAYNAGPGAVDRYNGIPPYPETVNYVRRVLKQYEKARKQNGAAD
jgi:soluble lytic murein transglycosylase-like protein